MKTILSTIVVSMFCNHFHVVESLSVQGSSNEFPMIQPDLSSFKKLNAKPIVAVLSQELPRSLENAFPNENYTSYIGAAYVKYLESAGARVVPVLINQDHTYYEMIFNSTNGLLIPGGAVSLTDSGYAKAGKIFYELAKRSWDEFQDPYPIWGTCLGFELLTLFANNDERNLMSCWSQDQALALDLTGEWDSSFIGQAMPEAIKDIVTTERVTINFHRWCLTPANFSFFHMEDFWKLLATGKDLEGLEFVAAIEAHNYPFWATQFHPEKNAYEWTDIYLEIPHFKNAISSSMFFAEFFVEQARSNFHEFQTRELEQTYLIYNYNPVYTGRDSIGFAMQQTYLFTDKL